jgi:hypothetical protein
VRALYELKNALMQSVNRFEVLDVVPNPKWNEQSWGMIIFWNTSLFLTCGIQDGLNVSL